MADMPPGPVSDVLEGFARSLDIGGFGVYDPDGVVPEGDLPILVAETTAGLYIALYPTTVIPDVATGTKLVTVQVRTAHPQGDRLAGWGVHDRIAAEYHRRMHLVYGDTRISAVYLAAGTALLDEDADRYILTSNFRFTCNP